MRQLREGTVRLTIGMMRSIASNKPIACSIWKQLKRWSNYWKKFWNTARRKKMNTNPYTHEAILAPDVIDSKGLGFKVETIVKFAANELTLETGTQLTRRAKDMSTDYETATKIADDASKMFKKSYSDLIDITAQLQASAKKASGDVRKSADDLAQGLIKVQKQADFNNLTRYVELLERAATAMTTLAELEKAGKLQKIAGALK